MTTENVDRWVRSHGEHVRRRRSAHNRYYTIAAHVLLVDHHMSSPNKSPPDSPRCGRVGAVPALFVPGQRVHVRSNGVIVGRFLESDH
jgi:hypothetical protein